MISPSFHSVHHIESCLRIRRLALISRPLTARCNDRWQWPSSSKQLQLTISVIRMHLQPWEPHQQGPLLMQEVPTDMHSVRLMMLGSDHCCCG